MNSGALRLISGVGSKGPACFLLETGGKRLLLDLGEGPPPGSSPDVAGLAPVDAVILSHGHKDHVGGLTAPAGTRQSAGLCHRDRRARLCPRPSPRVRCRSAAQPTCSALRSRPAATAMRRAASGCIFVIGDGFLYTGDYLDGVVALRLRSADERRRDRADRLLLWRLPKAARGMLAHARAVRRARAAPPSGTGQRPRSGDRARTDAARHRRYLCRRCDAECACSALPAAISRSLRAGLRDEIERLVQIVKPIDGARGVMLAASADGASGATAKLLAAMSRTQPEVTILFTGYVNPNTPAERLTKSGRAQTMRWNVHPRLSDTVELVRRCRPRP